jgi:hypothetical protein
MGRSTKKEGTGVPDMVLSACQGYGGSPRKRVGLASEGLEDGASQQGPVGQGEKYPALAGGGYLKAGKPGSWMPHVTKTEKAYCVA